ncbi:hypothetical protein BD324DRAFT_100421 [Kockovaella imperatae]|uniref:Uncharacterized protein n=1 Tax=Kockovaella imperatae TaxID=4999 RepID=A0A1Y1UD39_9TREE|nr:hypothetical protein BD324DRAFT_100421 [Kockovaella imperatae]ORX35457.1 hypothetical protein BD324DRAFT_100421 [Kockovaella imperatae]
MKDVCRSSYAERKRRASALGRYIKRRVDGQWQELGLLSLPDLSHRHVPVISSLPTVVVSSTRSPPPSRLSPTFFPDLRNPTQHACSSTMSNTTISTASRSSSWSSSSASSLAFLFALVMLSFGVQGAQGFMPYMACRAACNSAYLSCMSVYASRAISGWASTDSLVLAR